MEFLKPALEYAGKGVLFDIEDAHLFAEHRWWINSNGYLETRINGKKATFHRVVLGLTDPKIQGDHKNGNRLDNRRSNLRPATYSINAQNRVKLARNNTTGFRGVTARTTTSGRIRYAAQAVKMPPGGKQKTIKIGYYDTAAEAGAAARAWRLKNMSGATS